MRSRTGEFHRRWLQRGCAPALLAIAGCAGSLGGPQGDLVSLPGGSSLVFQGAISTSEERPRLEQLTRDAVRQARALIPLDGITVRIRPGSTGGVVPQIGFGGRANAGTVTMTIDRDSPAWPATLETEFLRVLTHELHHVARFRAIGFSENLLEAMVTEGLADQFMVELAGGGPPIWANALVDDALDTWLERASLEWLEPQYDHAAWFFVGAPSDVPQWAGYAVGFEITRRFLAANPAARPSTLFAEPAGSFIPAN